MRVPFLRVPPDIHLRIFGELHVVDGVCLSLVKYELLSLSYFALIALSVSPSERKMNHTFHFQSHSKKRLTSSSKYMHALSPLVSPKIKIPLSIGSPNSPSPYATPENKGCHHCVPVLYFPAHCELNFHLRKFVPQNLKYCGKCKKFTLCRAYGGSNDGEFCGGCGVEYRKRFEVRLASEALSIVSYCFFNS